MGTAELVLILVIVVLFFGATRLPALGDSLGKALRNLKGAADRAVPDEPEREPERRDPPKELPRGPGNEP